MQFLNPYFLFGLVFLAIPIIVHLFNFRKYKIEYFTNTKLLKSLLQDTQKASKLKKRLLLATRLFALLFIILAFAQPYFKSKDILSGKNLVSIYIDNSYSMGMYLEGKQLLSLAQSHAKDIIEQVGDRAMYHILSADMLSQPVQTLNKAEALQEVDEIKLTEQQKNLAQIYDKQIKLAELYQAENKQLYWISDFQKYHTKSIPKPTLAVKAIQIFPNKAANVYIDSAWLFAPIYKVGEEASILVKSVKIGEENVKPILNFYQNDQLKSSKEILISDGGVIDTFRFKIPNNGWNRLKLEISDKNITYDNTYFLSLFVEPRPKVALIDFQNANKYLQYAFKADQNFEIVSTSFQGLNSELLSNIGLIVLNQPKTLSAAEVAQIKEWLQMGKNIAIFPPNSLDKHQWNIAANQLGISTILEQKTEKAIIRNLNTQDPLMSDIFSKIDDNSDFPTVEQFYKIDKYSSMPRQVIMSMNNGFPFLVRFGSRTSGKIFYFACTPSSEYTSFVQSPIFAPLLFKIGNSSQSSIQTSYLIDQNTTVNLPLKKGETDNVYKLKGNQVDMIPPQRQIGNILSCTIHEGNIQPGFYTLSSTESDKSYELALNIGRKESELEYTSSSELHTIYHNLDFEVTSEVGKVSTLSKINGGSSSWKWWAILAILMLLIEAGIIIFWSKIQGWLGK